MPTTNSRSGAWCVTSSKPSNNTFDVRPLRLQQLLRLLPAGLPSRSCRATRGRAVEQRRLHHRPLERSQSPRHRHGAAALSGTGAYRPARRGRLFGQLRPLRRYVAPCDGDAPHARPLRRGVLHRRGIFRPARHRRAVRRLRTSHRPHDTPQHGHSREHRHRADQDSGQDRLEAGQALPETRRLLLHASARGHRKGTCDLSPARGLGYRTPLRQALRFDAHHDRAAVRRAARGVDTQAHGDYGSADVARVTGHRVHRLRTDAAAEAADHRLAQFPQGDLRAGGARTHRRGVRFDVRREAPRPACSLRADTRIHFHQPPPGRPAPAL